MTGAPIHDVIRMATLTPAERTGIASDVGSLEPGKRADIVVLDRRLNVRRVLVTVMWAATRILFSLRAKFKQQP